MDGQTDATDCFTSQANAVDEKYDLLFTACARVTVGNITPF